MNKAQYDSLRPFIAVIKHLKENGMFVGIDVMAFKPIYENITSETLTTSCSNCILNALYRMYDYIVEYERNVQKY